MKSRIIKISLWYEDDFSNLSKDGKLLFLYLLTCPFIELTGIFKFPRNHIILETGLNEQELNKALKELEKIKKAFIYKGWIYVPKTEKHNHYSSGPKTGMKFKVELENIPKEIFEYFNQRYPYDTTMIGHINNKREYINNKTELIKDKTNKDMNENINPDDIPF